MSNIFYIIHNIVIIENKKYFFYANQKITKKEFPKALLEIPQPPEQLFIIGELPKEELIYLSIVGSRKFSLYGKEVCEKIIAGLKGYPIAIVSGFAMGIDTIAHKKQ